MSIRRIIRISSVCCPFLVAGVGLAAATGPEASTASTALGAAADGSKTLAIASALLTLVIGGLLLSEKPAYVERASEKIESEPIRSFFIGGVTEVAAAALLLIGFATMLLLYLALPAVVLLVIIGAIGTTLTLLTVGRTIVAERYGALVVGAVVAAIAFSLPVVGGLVYFVLSTIGVGAVIDLGRE